MQLFSSLPPQVRQYLLVTGNYWTFTLTDGALRMLVLLYFHDLGYAPLQIALLFIFYEFFGVVTNLVGGWLGARFGLNRTMNAGLLLQVMALSMLLVPPAQLSIPWVMGAQALSGIAKDLNKMSAKSAIKLLVPDGAQSTLYRWVALLTGSKNALKGAGFFLGGALLTLLGFRGTVFAMAAVLAAVWLFSMVLLRGDLGRATGKSKFRDIFSRSRAVNMLAAARLFLFAARDVWFVIALPVFLSSQFGWDHWQVGAFLALWIIGYGAVQAMAPRFTGRSASAVPDGRHACIWAGMLAVIPGTIAAVLSTHSALSTVPAAGVAPAIALIGGLMLFGVLFAINSSLHSYLIVRYARADGVSMDVGFYYMANAMGRLLGTLLSGWLYQVAGLGACLWVSSLLLAAAAALSLLLPRQ